jgi:threonine synthase
VFSTPSGNFGNLSAGVLARQMGLPVHRFVAATNLNHAVPTYLTTGNYEPKPSVATISNAMDVGNPSNFVRLTRLFGDALGDIQANVSGYYFDDDETRTQMQKTYRDYQYITCPHTAIGLLGLDAYRQQTGDTNSIGITLATAHPAKFPVVEEVLGVSVEVPERLAELAHRPKQAMLIPAQYEAFREGLLQTV